MENISNTKIRIETLIETENKITSELREMKDVRTDKDKADAYYNLLQRRKNITLEYEEQFKRFNFLLKMYKFGNKNDFENSNTKEILKNIIDIYNIEKFYLALKL